MTFKNFIRVFFNLFFRRNKIIKVYLDKKNGLKISPSSNLRHCHFNVIGRGNLIIIENHCDLRGLHIFMEGNNNKIVIGHNTIVNASKKTPTSFNACHGGSIVINPNCLFSNNIEIHTTDYHSIVDERGFSINRPSDVYIGKHCWIGLRSVLLKGTRLSDNTIVGACSLVAKSYEEGNIIIAGTPAILKKRKVSWTNERNWD